MSETSDLDLKGCRLQGFAFPGKPSKLSVEIARLMREGGPEGREKARELLQAAMDGNGVSSQTTSKGTRP
ncbi:hypothetical protein [Acidithiobacillus ferrooxidans]|jgi:hypothetical protein|uniref:hypothetical protein n=1 Tax=Acidithiobacillus ferrooxidans TaxID=920 RepID=UPI000A3F2F24|nr:hypothetical protein [Acidithiobacillus ferrooxidans]